MQEVLRTLKETLLWKYTYLKVGQESRLPGIVPSIPFIFGGGADAIVVWIRQGERSSVQSQANIELFFR